MRLAAWRRLRPQGPSDSNMSGNAEQVQASPQAHCRGGRGETGSKVWSGPPEEEEVLGFTWGNGVQREQSKLTLKTDEESSSNQSEQ